MTPSSYSHTTGIVGPPLPTQQCTRTCSGDVFFNYFFVFFFRRGFFGSLTVFKGNRANLNGGAIMKEDLISGTAVTIDG